MTQFSSTTKLIIQKVNRGEIPPDEIFGGFIKLSGAEVNFEPMLSNLGAKVQTKAGNIWTIRIPAGSIEKISSSGISYVDFQPKGSVGFAASNGNGTKSSPAKVLLGIGAAIGIIVLIAKFAK